MDEAAAAESERDFLDRQYNPRRQIPHYAEFFARWKRAALQARANAVAARFDVPYGDSAAETLDFFPAGGDGSAPICADPAPLLLFIHGGYWRALHKDDFSWVAPGYLRAGISVAIINYGLAPGVPVARIVEQVRRACVFVFETAAQLRIDRSRIVCSGHSAGGHLTAMMLATDWKRRDEHLPQRLLCGAVTISGVFDLEPLTRAEFLRHDLQLDAQGARLLSPAFLPCRNEVTMVRAVGANESAEFHRQSMLMERPWPQACAAPLLEVAACDHLSVCESFAAPESALFRATCSLFGKRPLNPAAPATDPPSD